MNLNSSIFLCVLVVLSLIITVHSAHPTEYIQMESMKMRGSVIKTNSKPHPDTMHELTFAIKQSNADQLHDMLMKRSTPGRPLYQQWMSNDEVRAMTSNAVAADALTSWFSENGIMIDWVNRGQEYFRVRSRIGTWERILRTTFHEFHEQTDDAHLKAIRAESYSLPVAIASHVKTVFGAVDFPVTAPKRSPSRKAFEFPFSSVNKPVDTKSKIETEAVSISGYVQLNLFPSLTCAGSSTSAADYAIGPCIPQSLASGSNSARFFTVGSSTLVTTYTDAYCQTILTANLTIPADGVCTPGSTQGETFTVYSGPSVPAPPFYSTSKVVTLYAYQGVCGGVNPIVAKFAVENGNIVCAPLTCTANNYQQAGFQAPVNYTTVCNSLASDVGVTTPATLQSQYGIPIQSGSVYATQSIFAALNQFFSPIDLRVFQNSYGLALQTLTVKQGHSAASCTGAHPCGEANLDVQYMTGLSQNTNTTFWYVYNTSSTDTNLIYLVELLELTNPPMVNSISYGAVEQRYSPNFLNQYAQEALKLGLMGVTLIVASGDDGVALFGARTSNCNTAYPPSMSNCACNAVSSSASYYSSLYSQTKNSWSGYGYFPAFPASCPYVTAVGATQLQSHTSGPEIVCSSQTGSGITSGGGFSSYYASLDWQTAAVAGYFQQVSSGAVPIPASGYNPLGRGIPDVSFNGDSFNIVLNGFSTSISGTSASAPSFAAMISTINGVRLAAGKGPVGFINPTLYANASVFNDITSGNNKCSAEGNCCNSGFYASKGWDPATGLGSVQYSSLYKILVNAPTSPDLNFAPSRSPVTLPPVSSQPSVSSQAPVSSQPQVILQPPVSSPLFESSMTPTVTTFPIADDTVVASKVVLSAGAIAGIVIAVVIILGIIVVALCFVCGVVSLSVFGIVQLAKNQSQKSSLNDGSWQTSTNVPVTDDRLSSGPTSRVSFGLKGINDAL